MDWEGNRNEYLTSALGYDGLMIRERAWDSYDYYPSGIGIDWSEIIGDQLWPPKTVAIYESRSILEFILYQNGYDQEMEITEINQR